MILILGTAFAYSISQPLEEFCNPGSSSERTFSILQKKHGSHTGYEYLVSVISLVVGWLLIDLMVEEPDVITQILLLNDHRG
jgi:hypothetical protein